MYPRTTHSTGSMSSLRTTSARPRTSSGTPSVALRKWLGTIWPVRSNQKTLSAVSTLPLSGMGVGWTTSYVEMRSEATIRRRSPRSYISRTFPDARRGRSETGGMRRRLSGLEDDDGDHPVRRALVVRIARVLLHEARPVGVALGVGRAPGADAPGLAAPQLDLGVRRREEVVKPRRVGVGAALGGDDDQVAAVGQVDHRRDALLARLAPDVVQQPDRHLLHASHEPGLARPPDRDVEPRVAVDELPHRRAGRRGPHASAGTPGSRSTIARAWRA